MSRVRGVLSGPFFSIFTAEHAISTGPCSALVRSRFCSICCLGRHLSERRKTEKTTLSGYFPFFFCSRSLQTPQSASKRKKKLPSPSLLASRAALTLPPMYLSSPPPSFLHQSLTPCLHPSQSSLCSLESIRCTAAFPPLGGRAAFCFFLLH